MLKDDKPTSSAKVVSINSRQTFVKTPRANVTAGVLKVTPAKEPARRTHVEQPLTKEQRSEIKSLINDWVSTSNLVRRPITHGAAYGKLYDQHLNGEVNQIGQVEQREFGGCVAWLKQQIIICEEYDRPRTRNKPGRDTRMIGTIQARCKELGVSDEKRKQYQIDRWGHDSLTKFSTRELEEFQSYVRQDRPTFEFAERINPRDQELRERALAQWLDDKEAEARANGEPFNRQALRQTRAEILAELMARDRQLFTIAQGTFERFWKDKPAGMCRAKTGRRPRAT